MKILIVSSFFPYPLYSGGYIRLYNLIKQLAKKHEITLVCEKRSKQNVKAEDIKEVEKFCKEVIIVPTKKQWSLKNILKTSISPYPFLLTGHTSQEMKHAIVNLLKTKTFHIIHVETFYVYQNLPKTYLPVVLAEHNIEYNVYKKFVNTAPLPLRPLLLADIEKMKYWEKRFWKQATKVVTVSESDKSHIERNDVVVAPNGVDIESFPFVLSKKKFLQKEKRILFMGDFKWIQNQNAAEWIIKEIWPKIVSNEKQKIKLWIVGKDIPDSLKELGDSSILFDEHAPDNTAKIYEKAYLLLAPIAVGGGTSYKILESMSSGVPVVTTPLGAVGLGLKHEKEALIGKTTEELAKESILLLNSREIYEKITIAARRRIEEKYSWKEITKILEHVYESAAKI